MAASGALQAHSWRRQTRPGAESESESEWATWAARAGAGDKDTSVSAHESPYLITITQHYGLRENKEDQSPEKIRKSRLGNNTALWLTGQAQPDIRRKYCSGRVLIIVSTFILIISVQLWLIELMAIMEARPGKSLYKSVYDLLESRNKVLVFISSLLRCEVKTVLCSCWCESSINSTRRNKK